MNNIEIAQLLRNVAAAYSIIDGKKYYFQIVAYQKAADTIENSTTQISDLIREDKLDDIPGLGASIQAHLKELMKTGEVKHFASVIEQVPASVFPLLAIPSFGPKKAIKLVTAFNLHNPETVITDVEKKATEGAIATLEGFGEKSQSDILRAITEYRKGFGKTTRMLLPFATELADKIVSYIKQHPDVHDAQPLGSLRRKMPTVGDIDIAVATDNAEAVIAHFAAYPYQERLIEKGPTSVSLLTSGGHQVDLMTQPVASFGSLLQHFTGSKHHNVHLRDIALKKHLSLSERGIKQLTKKDQPIVSYDDEKKFYEAIGLDWVPPEMREDNGEIELAMQHKLPTLIALKDIKGDFHIHSNYPIEPSHDLGADTMQHMVNKAIELGYDYIAFSEHNPSVSKHKPDEIAKILEKRAKHIEHIQESNKSIRILKMLEIDILTTGKLAISDSDFDYLDAGIVSIHSSFSMDVDSMTERVLKGLAHPKAKILAHPTGRLINERQGYALNWDKIFDFCIEHEKALEINSWPERTDLPDTVIRQAVKRGVKLVINTDSHATSHMQLMRYGIENARRGWATRDDIINAMSYNQLKKWLHI